MKPENDTTDNIENITLTEAQRKKLSDNINEYYNYVENCLKSMMEFDEWYLQKYKNPFPYQWNKFIISSSQKDKHK